MKYHRKINCKRKENVCARKNGTKFTKLLHWMLLLNCLSINGCYIVVSLLSFSAGMHVMSCTSHGDAHESALKTVELSFHAVHTRTHHVWASQQIIFPFVISLMVFVFIRFIWSLGIFPFASMWNTIYV